jgi:biotin synthase
MPAENFMNRETIISFLRTDATDALMQQADAIRREHCGDKVFIRGIIEFSNHCMHNCFYCGLRKDNAVLTRYRMSVDEIVSRASDVAKQEIGTVVLQSGDDSTFSRAMICEIIAKIKKYSPQMAVTLSIGERPLEDYKAFRYAGADRYLLKHETINPKLYQALHPGQSLDTRLRILDYLRELDYQVGIGCILGLPGQTIEDLVDELMFIEKFEPDMIGIGPFLPQGNTPLKEHILPPVSIILKFIALARIISKNALIPATTALLSMSRDQGVLGALSAGCNVIMVNFTPEGYRPLYRIYDNKAFFDINYLASVIQVSGRKLSLCRGDSLKKEELIVPI